MFIKEWDWVIEKWLLVYLFEDITILFMSFSFRNLILYFSFLTELNKNLYLLVHPLMFYQQYTSTFYRWMMLPKIRIKLKRRRSVIGAWSKIFIIDSFSSCMPTFWVQTRRRRRYLKRCLFLRVKMSRRIERIIIRWSIDS